MKTWKSMTIKVPNPFAIQGILMSIMIHVVATGMIQKTKVPSDGQRKNFSDFTLWLLYGVM